MNIGLIREGKIPPDKRVALLPEQCKEITERYPGIRIYVQPSPIRCVKDEDYAAYGFPLQEDLGNCDVLLGIKEVPISQLIPNKMYFFFSHTVKKQKYNRKLLQAILQKNITLIDYECLVDNAQSRQRIIAFGRYAGIVGTYNAFWTYGKKYKLFNLKRAYECTDMQEMRNEFTKITLPPVKIVVTGTGRVGQGAVEILDEIRIRRVSPEEFLNESFIEPVYTVLRSQDYYAPADGRSWDSAHFRQHPQEYESRFLPYAQQANILITTAFWHPRAPRLFSREDMQRSDFSIRVIADISCDVDGSVPCTIRTSTIVAPVYDYNPVTHNEDLPFSSEDAITVMAIDNLPCELPYDASGYFGRQFVDQVLPHLINNDQEGVLALATITRNGQLTESYQYLEDFVNENAEE